MKNTFSKATAHLQLNVSTITAQLRSIYGIPILIFAFLTLGVGQAWASVDYVVGCAASNSNNYSVRLNVNRQNWSWYEWTMEKAGLTFEGKKLYIKKYETDNGWVNDIQFLMKDGSGTQKEYKSAYAGSGTQGYSNQIYNYDGGSWYTKLSFSTSARFYFDASTWDETSIKLVIGHANHQKYYSLSRITNTKLYYGNSRDTWGDAMHIGVVGGTTASDGTNWPTDISDKASEYTGLKNYALSSASAGNVYLMVPNGKTGQQPDMHYYATHYNTDALNSTQTIKYAVGVNGGTPATLTSGYVPADIAISSYKFSSGTYNSVSSSSGSVTLSQGGSNYNATVTAARTATTTYTVSNVHEDYSFLGWYSAASGGTLLSSELSYTFYPTSATTAYARFSKENNHSVTISRYCTSTSTEINNTSAKIGEVTYSEIAAPEIYGYTFVNWEVGNGLSIKSGDNTNSNPIHVKTLSSGTYTLRANYTEDLSSTWYVSGAGIFGGWGSSGKNMQRKTGHSAEKRFYYTIDATRVINGETSDSNLEFKIYNSDGASYRGNNGYWVTRSNYQPTLSSESGSNMQFRPDAYGTYEFKLDCESPYSESAPKLTVTFGTKRQVNFGKRTGGKTVTAKYKNSVSMTSGQYVMNGSSVTFSQTANDGYTFEGWYNAASGGTRVSTSASYTTTISAATTIYSNYTENKTSITITTDGHGTITTPSPVSNPYSLGVATTQAINASPNTGYHWNTWTVSGNAALAFTATTQSNTAKGNGTAGGSGTVTATFSPNTYRVQFHRNGASEATVSQNFTYDVAQNLTANTYTRTGYTFAGWALSTDGAVEYANGAEVSNLTSENGATFHLYAKWTPISYTVVLNKQTSAEGYGGSEGTVANQTVTFDATPATVSGTMPTAKNGWAFMGFYSAEDGGGRRFIDSSGNWITSAGDTISGGKWVKPEGITLYAYYKKAEITNLTFDAAVVAPSASVGVTPTVAPTPAGTNSICWKLLYSNGNLYEPQPTFSPASPAGISNKVTFNAPPSSGMYLVAAVLRTGSSCDSGTKLDSVTYPFQVAGDHTVTVQYKCGNTTIKAPASVTGKPLQWTEITAPEIVGYSFSKWVEGDGITIDGATEGEKAEETINFKAIYDGKLTAVYTQKRMIYFYNTLNWENVYVYFYKNDSYFGDTNQGTGANTTWIWTNTPYGEGLHGQMLPVEEGSKIYYFDAEAAGVNASYTNVVFTELNQHGCDYFYNNNKVVRRGDYQSTTMPLFVPLSDQSAISKNGGTANYYCEGYWMNYPANSGYTLRIYDTPGANNATGASREFLIPFSEDVKMPLKQEVEVNFSGESWFIIYRNDGKYLEGEHTFKQTDHGDKKITSTADASTAKKMRLISDGSGIYTFTLSFRGDGDEHYDYYLNVDFPAAVGDYRIVYSDNATWSNGAHGAGWYHPSDIIGKNTSETEAKEDTVSFFISHGSSPSMKFQRISAISESAGSYGKITWEDVPSGSITIPTSITASGVYNFIVTQPAGGASISLVKAEPYTGNYYIRTDCAGETKWNNFRSPDHLITYSEYSITHGGYSHYYTHWVQTDDKRNIQFCIANDYSSAISDTLIRENNSDPAWTNINNYIDENGNILRNANVRFMWNQSTNKISRAYVDGAQGTGSNNFLYMLSEDNKIRKTDRSALDDHKVLFSDNENWIYEANIQAQPKAAIKLLSNWGTSNTITQYFKGSSTSTEDLIDGSGYNWYNIRLLYDFKTNRLIAAMVPTGNIDAPTPIHADVMFIREHQGDIDQLTFTDDGSIADIKTAYAVMRFNKWTLNNKDKDTHLPLASPASPYERAMYFISFPFEVKLSEVFGIGNYGQDWIVEYYDGAERARTGWWEGEPGFWRYVWNRKDFVLKPNVGYLLQLELAAFGEESSAWNNNNERLELFFPSSGNLGTITNTTVNCTIPEHACTINRHETEGLPDTGDPRTSYNRTIFDSHWNVMSVPTYVKATPNAWGNNTWTTAIGPKFLYTWNPDDNTLTATSGKDFEYHAMHAYMVQYGGNVQWVTSGTDPASIVARDTYAEQPKEVEFRIEIQQNEKMVDQTFVIMSNDDEINANFQFGEDMSKDFNARNANIYTMTADNVASAGNTLPMSETTTIVPVGVSVKKNGEYTFAIPEGTEGIGVTLVDNETGVRTSLSALDYTVTLQPGDYTGRFVLEISPIQNTPTGLEEPTSDSSLKGRAQKVMIDGILYIVKDGKIFDARGARVE